MRPFARTLQGPLLTAALLLLPGICNASSPLPPPLPVLGLALPANNRAGRILVPPVKPPRVPDTYGRRYTNVLSSLPGFWWQDGISGLSTNFVPHHFAHDPATGRITLDWPSAPGQSFRLDWTHTNAPFYPLPDRVGAWFNTNRTRWEIDWPTNRTGFVPGHFRVALE